MECFKTIDSMAEVIDCKLKNGDEDAGIYRDIMNENPGMFEFLRVLENTNPCGQKYYLFKRLIIISYMVGWEFFRLGKWLSLKFRFRMIGLPVSLSNAGYLYAKNDGTARDSICEIIKEAADSLKGLTVVLNADDDIGCGNMGLSTYVFHNRFGSFTEYISSLRRKYLLSVKAALEKGRDIRYVRLEMGGFTNEHYELYLKVCERAPMVFRTLPFGYFEQCSEDIFEARNGDGGLLAILQLRDIDGVLYFIYVGFGQNDVCDKMGISQMELYYNLLLFVIKHGIENGYKKIVFGQTSTVSKSRVGCTEEAKYMYITSSNPVVKLFLRLFPSICSFKQNNVEFHVFKDINQRDAGS